MYNLTCWALRASVNATDTYSEMLEIQEILHSTKRSFDVMDFYPIPNQRQWLQILCSSTTAIAQLPTKLLEIQREYPDRMNLLGVNLNIGCPSPEILAACEGAALLKSPNRVIQMIKAFLGEPNSHPFRISVKMRLGWDLNSMLQKAFVPILEGLKALDDSRVFPPILHFKHAAQDSEEIEYWEMLKDAMNVGIPLVINGSIKDIASINKIRNKLPTQLQGSEWKRLINGIMIGRAALKDLNVFSQFASFSTNQKPVPHRIHENLDLHTPPPRFLEALHKFF
jgi:tRNA-dihydrouridine synthase